jgi:hypothetical protein
MKTLRTLSPFINSILVLAVTIGLASCGGGAAIIDTGGSLTKIKVTGVLSDNAALTPPTVSDPIDVTHVAVVEQDGSLTTSPIGTGGSFEIEIPQKAPVAMALLKIPVFGGDTRTRSGTVNIVKGVFKAGELDTILSLSGNAGNLPVGTLFLDETAGTAEMTTDNYDQFIADLNISSNGADMYGTNDQLMLQKLNIDVNRNGIIDGEESGLPNFWTGIWYHFQCGNAGFLETNEAHVVAGEELETSGISFVFHSYLYSLQVRDTDNSFRTARPRFKMSCLDDSDAVVTEFSSIQDYSSYSDEVNYKSIAGGSAFDPDVNGKVPEGAYLYTFYDSGDNTVDTFRFDNVKTLADVRVPEDFVFPFPVFNVDGTSDISSIDYTWKKLNGSTFVNATSEEVELSVSSGAQISWYTLEQAPVQNRAQIDFLVADTNYAASGTLPISMVGTEDNPPLDKVNSLKRSDIKRVEVTYTTKIGVMISLLIAGEYIPVT